MKSILYSFIILFLCFTTYAQNTVVRGTIVDAKTKEAVPFANVVFKGTRIGAIADINGVYLLTGGFFVVGWLVDLLLIPNIVSEYNDTIDLDYSK